MAETRRTVRATPEEVFGVLADPRGYAYWVIGSKEIRDADPHWPAAGSRFHHTVGVGPFRVRDYTSVEEIEPGRFLQLRTNARPLGVARVKLELEPTDGGTEVTMVEQPAGAATAFVFNPLTHLLTDRRNVRSLERLAELAEGRVPIPGEEPGAPVGVPRGDGAVQNPAERERPGAPSTKLLLRGLGVGFVGSLAMIGWTQVEKRLLGRGPSRAPAKVARRMTPVRAMRRRDSDRLVSAAQTGLGLGFGVLLALLRARGTGRAPADGMVFVAAVVPEATVVPVIGAEPPPWRWGSKKAVSVAVRHGVYVLAADVTHEFLTRR